MEELPLGIQMKLREMPGAESGTQVVEVILEDGRIVPTVTVVDCVRNVHRQSLSRVTARNLLRAGAREPLPRNLI